MPRRRARLSCFQPSGYLGLGSHRSSAPSQGRGATLASPRWRPRGRRAPFQAPTVRGVISCFYTVALASGQEPTNLIQRRLGVSPRRLSGSAPAVVRGGMSGTRRQVTQGHRVRCAERRSSRQAENPSSARARRSRSLRGARTVEPCFAPAAKESGRKVRRLRTVVRCPVGAPYRVGSCLPPSCS
jgi:hypothetical protein